MPNKQSATTAYVFWNWYNTQYNAIIILPPVFVQMDDGGEFVPPHLPGSPQPRTALSRALEPGSYHLCICIGKFGFFGRWRSWSLA
jgi:hypothetical protein